MYGCSKLYMEYVLCMCWAGIAGLLTICTFSCILISGIRSEYADLNQLGNYTREFTGFQVILAECNAMIVVLKYSWLRIGENYSRLLYRNIQRTHHTINWGNIGTFL